MSRADYNERKEARIDRYEARALKAQAESDAAFKRSHEMMDAIPFEQPILVGHYSEGRDRRYRDRAWNLLGKGVQAADKAAHYADKAAAAESNNAISSDDPEALDKLDARIAELEAKREAMKLANASYRRDHGAELRAMTSAYQRSIAVPFPAYSLQNIGGNIARLKERRDHIAALEAKAAAGNGRAETVGDVRIAEELDDNRTRIYFPDKPADAVRTLLKARGFRWSPTAGAWQRQCSEGAWYWALECARAAQ